MNVFEYIDIILFTFSLFTVGYMLIFAFAALFNRSDEYTESRVKHRFAVVFPSYKDDEYILDSVESFLQQDYPIDCYEIIVVADHMHEETIEALQDLEVNVMEVNFERGSKMKSVKQAVKRLPADKYDIILIMNADNVTDPQLLNELNNTYASGSNAIQTHRIRRERPNTVTILNALSDEVNNSIFRTGHVNCGLSSSLNGSGMAFDLKWFKEIYEELDDFDDEKAIEALLLRDRTYIEYLNNAVIYATRKENNRRYYAQRTNWIKTHYSSLIHNIFRFPIALLSGNFDYADRILQWVCVPRTLLIPIICIWGVVCLFVDWMLAFKWIGLFLLLLFAFSLAIPDYLVDKRFSKAMRGIPAMGFGMLLSMIGIRRKSA
jgi:cellulose synthase/poly-beta-1,6-N-acetylglucosamine synthase-like glycosyltransferase